MSRQIGLVEPNNPVQTLSNVKQAVAMLMYVDLEEVSGDSAMGVFNHLAMIHDAVNHEIERRSQVSGRKQGGERDAS